MSAEAIFRREGELFHPTELATSPWGADRLHGGPVAGLLVRAVEQEVASTELITTRLTLDLFRVVPRAPLAVHSELVRRSARMALVQVSVWHDGSELVRASALLLRPTEGGHSLPPTAATPSGPEGIETRALMRAAPGQPPVRPGFHARVETRWVPRTNDEPLAIWFRLPVPLIEGETPSALQQLAAASDFANAIPNIAAHTRGEPSSGYINVDSTVYLTRRPVGEWYCLRETHAAAASGISTAAVSLHDQNGQVGQVLQARLQNQMR
ncbi:MAG: thioesterase family protein [Polyangiales bacterium]